MKHDLLTNDFYLAHHGAMVDYAAKVLGSRDQAEDVVQEAWFSLRSSAERGQVHQPLAYLRTTVRNLAIDMLRKRVRESRITAGDIDSAAQTIADGSPSPESETGARQDLACVLRVLRSLPERERVAIEMYRFGDHKLREIAAHLGVSVPLVHLFISRGLAICAEKCGLDGACKK